jgi:hypothetical protein
MSRTKLFLALAPAALIMGSEADAQAPRYDTPLQATVTRVDRSALSAPQNRELATALERRLALAEDAPGQTKTALTSRALAPESSVLRVKIRFAELPQRAMEPRLLANDRVIGSAVGELEQVEDGVEVEFVVFPEMVGNFYFDPDAPVDLAVQMGEDERTKSPLESAEAVDALRSALTEE